VEESDPGVEEFHIVRELGHGSHGGAGGPHGVLAVNGNGRRDVLDPVHLRPVHALHELTRIGREGLHVAALAFRVEGVKGERGFAGTAQTCNDRDAVERDVEIEILEIVLPGTPDSDDRGVQIFLVHKPGPVCIRTNLLNLNYNHRRRKIRTPEMVLLRKVICVIRGTMKESLRYLNNAKEILKTVPVEDSTYTDVKPVREAMGTAYLAVLEAINEHLIKQGFTKKELPKSVEGYRKLLQKYVAVRNGKVLREFEKLYDMLHIAGYYRGLLYDRDVVKQALKAAKSFIDKLD
jgi:hypothetical protein